MKPEGGFGGASFAPPAPVITRLVIGLCVGVQLVTSFGGAGIGDAIVRHAGLVPARLTGLATALPGDLPATATLVTSTFVHGGWLHLFVNLSFLLWVGRHVEAVAGHAAFALLFVASGIAGGLVEIAVTPASIVPVVGASGAIAGVFGTYAMLFARRRLASKRVLGVTIGGAALTAVWYLTAWIALQLLTALALNRGVGGVAIWTHIGGFVVGLLAARPIARRRV